MDNAFATRGVGRGEDVGTSGVARVSQLVMHVEGGVQPEPAVVMLGVVPVKDVFAVRARLRANRNAYGICMASRLATSRWRCAGCWATARH
jgi:hypothetical protein